MYRSFQCDDTVELVLRRHVLQCTLQCRVDALGETGFYGCKL